MDWGVKMLQNKNVLVTGGAGFIGSTLVRELLKEKANVIVYDNFLIGDNSNLKEVEDQIKIIKKDILDDDLKDKFDLLHSKNLVIIFNTCHAGGMIDGAHDVAESGRVVLTSCDVDEASYSMRIPYDWIFPYYCVKGLQNHADRNNDKCVSAEEMFEYTVGPVEFRAYLLSFFHPRRPIGSSSQHPQMYDGWPTEEDNADELILVDLGGN